MLIDQQKHPKDHDKNDEAEDDETSRWRNTKDQDKNDEAEDDEDKKDSKSPKESVSVTIPLRTTRWVTKTPKGTNDNNSFPFGPHDG